MSEFNSKQFINRIGRKLVGEFEDAAEAGTPGLIGAAREHPARLQLTKLLPAFLSSGSGRIIDSYGSKSTQQDIVLFERDFCPVFSINDTPEVTFFPIETTVAVGEVKSTVGKSVLFDALGKIKSAKSLRRYKEDKDIAVNYSPSFRTFGSNTTYATVPNDDYNQERNPKDQLFAFILCNKFATTPSSILDNLIEYQRSNGHEFMPNIIVSLNDGFIQGLQSRDFSLQYSPTTSDSFGFVPVIERGFSHLVRELRRHAQDGRSVPLSSLDRYLNALDDGNPLPPCTARRFERRESA